MEPADRVEQAVVDIGTAKVGVIRIVLIDLAGVDREL